ncbi:ParA family protein [Xanthomonas perforans]|uniref:ParA family protein n=1 Tax=Xanthomonas perforans TaxID=442694 RepID=UPI0013DEB6D5|nr:ParA family protein [Xanthomonas perforans]
MKILSVSQHKGGVGKTSLCKILAVGFARMDQRVLAIDLDSQCNLSKRFLEMIRDPDLPDGSRPPVHPEYDSADMDWSGTSSSADIFMGREVVPYPTEIPNLDVLPGNGEDLRAIEHVTLEDAVARVHGALREFLRTDAVESQYDIIIVDTPPSKNALVHAAIRAATHVIVPSVMEPNSVDGLEGMIALWTQESRNRAENDEIVMIGILPNMYRSNVALHAGVRKSLMDDRLIGPMMIQLHLAQRAAFAESDHDSARPGSVFTLPAKNAARKEAENVVKHIAQVMRVSA